MQYAPRAVRLSVSFGGTLRVLGERLGGGINDSLGEEWRSISLLLEGDIQVSLLLDPSPFGARSVFDPFK